MKLISIVQCSLLTTLAICSSGAFSTETVHSKNPSKQHAGAPLAKASIQAYDKDFSYNWDKFSTIAANKSKVKKTEAFVRTFYDYTVLSFDDRQALGSLLYKLGTFYSHVLHEPDMAIEKMKYAQMLLITRQEKAWNNNQLAYAYEQKYANTGRTTDKENALSYINIVLSELYPNTSNKEVAFAYCVKGLLSNDAKDYAQAENNYKIALNMYEQLPDGKDEQYARVKNRLASIMLEQDAHSPKALAMLEEVKKYWTTKGDMNHNPYAGKNLISLGQAHMKTGKIQMACSELNKGIEIYKNVYGKDDIMLTTPYKILADAYKAQKNIKLAALYEDKADHLTA